MSRTAEINVDNKKLILKNEKGDFVKEIDLDDGSITDSGDGIKTVTVKIGDDNDKTDVYKIKTDRSYTKITTTTKKEDGKILEIFHEGINYIIDKLIKKFGNNNEKVNEAVSAITSLFENIDGTIDRTITTEDIKAEDDFKHNALITKKDQDTRERSSEISGQHVEQTPMAAQFEQMETTNINGTTTKNIDNIINGDYKAAMDESRKLNMTNPKDIEELETRLKNCQAFEIIHLKLYENFMKTGAFTLTLYEKYKYITHVMLYLLKNLVYKPKLTKQELIDNGCDTSNQIKLPKTIIKNIGKLVEEQDNIQKTIDGISNGLNDTDLDKLYNNDISETIKTNLKNKKSPIDKPTDEQIKEEINDMETDTNIARYTDDIINPNKLTLNN
jgi:hypothetical protein